MKICVLTHSFPRSEKDVAAAFMKELCDGLVQAGNKVVLVTPFDKNFKRRGDPFKIVIYKYIWPPEFHVLGYSQTMEADINLRKSAFILIPFMIFFGTFALLKTVKKEKVDVINAHWILPNGLTTLIVSKITRIPFVITLPGTDAYLAHRFKIFGLVAKIIANNSSGIISNSSWHLKRILKLGVKNKLTEIIPYPVDVSRLKPTNLKRKELQKRYGMTDKNFIALAVGRLVYKKGFSYLIQAAALISKKFPQIRLIIGGEGDLMEELKNLAKKLRIFDKVIFTGTISRDEIIHYYNLSDVMVAPSIVDKYGNVDGGPVVSFESMACAKPQIVTDVLGVADIMEDSVNGFIVPQKDPKALARALEDLIKSVRLRQKMGKANRSLIVSKLSTKSIGDRYSGFFDKVL